LSVGLSYRASHIIFNSFTQENDQNVLPGKKVQLAPFLGCVFGHGFFSVCTQSRLIRLSSILSPTFTRVFEDAESFDGDLSSWDTSRGESFHRTFAQSSSLNPLKFTGESISGWNMSAAEDLSFMFYSCESLTADLSNWTVSKVKSMSSAFFRCKSFNSELSDWDVSSVEDMRSAFAECENFDSNIANWDTSNVKSFEFMFYRAKIFNQDLSSWNMSSATVIRNMFAECDRFNQNMCPWTSTLPSDVSYIRAFWRTACPFEVMEWKFEEMCHSCLPTGEPTVAPTTAPSSSSAPTSNETAGSDSSDPCGGGSTEYIFDLFTDRRGYETSWTIANPMGEIVAFGPPAGETYGDYVFVSKRGCLPAANFEQYLLTVYDTGGNGLCCQNGYGFYQLAVGTQVVDFGQFFLGFRTITFTV